MVVRCVEMTITKRAKGPEEGDERGLDVVCIASSLIPSRAVRI